LTLIRSSADMSVLARSLAEIRPSFAFTCAVAAWSA
jgi:hypothetical protein